LPSFTFSKECVELFLLLESVIAAGLIIRFARREERGHQPVAVCAVEVGCLLLHPAPLTIDDEGHLGDIEP
jgi:hypothetical protein